VPQGTSNDIGNSGAAKAQPVDTNVKPPLGKKRKVEYVCVLQAARPICLCAISSPSDCSVVVYARQAMHRLSAAG